MFLDDMYLNIQPKGVENVKYTTIFKSCELFLH